MESVEEIDIMLNYFGIDTERLISNFNSILELKLSSCNELMKFLKFESHDNFKHLSLLIGMNMLEFICENSYFLNEHYISVTLLNIISMFKNKLNLMLEESDDYLVTYIIQSYIESNLSHLSPNDMEDNKDLIDNYRANYMLSWYHYQDLIGKIIKQIIDGYITYLCINKIDKSKFIYVILSGILEYSFNNIDESFKVNVNREFENIIGDISSLIDLKGNQYMNFIIESIKLSLSDKKIIKILENTPTNKIIIEGTINNDGDLQSYKFSGFIFNLIKSVGYSFILHSDIVKQYLMIKKLFDSIFVTRDLLETIIKLNNSILENLRYQNIILGESEGLIIRQISLNGDEEFLFTWEINETADSDTDINKNVKMKTITIMDDPIVIYDLFNCLRCQNIKFLGIHDDYDIKNMKSIMSFISKDSPLPKISTMEYLTKGLTMDIGKFAELNSYLLKYKISRINDKHGMKQLTEGEKQRIKIVKMLLDDKPIWIINDCLCNIGDKTKRIIIEDIIKKVKNDNKTLIIFDSSSTSHYWSSEIENLEQKIKLRLMLKNKIETEIEN